MQPKHRILALLFELQPAESGRLYARPSLRTGTGENPTAVASQSAPGRIVLLIAWLDASGNSRFLVPVHPCKTLLDVRVGDMLTFQRKEHFVIRRLKPWRTTECRDETEYAEIVCGADWESEAPRN